MTINPSPLEIYDSRREADNAAMYYWGPRAKRRGARVTVKPIPSRPISYGIYVITDSPPGSRSGRQSGAA